MKRKPLEKGIIYYEKEATYKKKKKKNINNLIKLKSYSNTSMN